MKKKRTSAPLPPPPARRRNGKFYAIACAVIALVTVAVYASSIRNEFTNWDDDRYVLQNPLLGDLSMPALTKVFSTYFQGNYHPLALLSLDIDYAVSGRNPFAYHLFNLLLHLCNTFLVFLLVIILTRERFIAFFAALLFGVHTLHVESVAWASERKDLLYAFFFLGGLICYGKYCFRNRRLFYVLSLIFLFLSLLSKGQAAAMPLSVMAIDWLLRKKTFSKKSLLEKVPFFILALVFGVIAIFAQRTGGAIKEVAWIYRIPVACYGFSVYILKLFVPIHLAAMYPYPFAATGAIPCTWFLLSLAFIALIGFLLFLSIKRGDRLAAFGIIFFTVTIAFTLQLLPVGRAIMADRYAYIPSIGFCLIVAASYRYTVPRPLLKKAWFAALAIYIALLSVLTWQRVGVWHDSFTLWSDCIAKEPAAFEAYANRALPRLNIFHDYDGAIADCSKSLQFVSKNAPALTCRGVAYYYKSQREDDPAEKRRLLTEAVSDLRASMAIVPDQPNEEICMGNGDLDLGNLQDALADFKAVLVLHPDNVTAMCKMGFCYFRLKQPDSVIFYCSKALSIDPHSALAYGNIGLAYQQKAAAINPSPGNMGLAYQQREYYSQAADYYEKALRIDPKIDPAYLSNFTGICLYLHDPDRANRYRPGGQ
jgi:tetratricopeptide (TPR) repeat protein